MVIVVGDVWRLCRGDDVLAEVTITRADFPWLTGTLAVRPAFAEVASLFAEELALTAALEDDDGPAAVAAWDAVQARIGAVVTLVAPHGPVAEHLLHVDVEAGEAWFRWSDEPFPRD